MAEMKNISDALRWTGDNIVLVFPTKDAGRVVDETPPAGRAFFFKILSATKLVRKYTDIMTAETLDYLDTETGIDYDYLGDEGIGAGDDILRIENNPWWIYHFGFTPAQNSLRVYRRLSISGNITGWEYEPKDSPDPTEGADFGFVRGAEVENYFDPPIDTEMVQFHNHSDGEMWEFGFYNESDEHRINPYLYITGRAYYLIPVVSRQSQIDLLYGKEYRRLITMPPFEKYDESTVIPGEWIDVGCDMEVTWADLTCVYPRGKQVERISMTVDAVKKLESQMRRGETYSETIQRLSGGR